MQASDFKMVGDNAYRRNYIQQGKTQSDGKLDQETMRVLKMTILMVKLGCNRLANTYSFEKGGMSSRQARRHLGNGTIPSFKIRMTTCLDPQGKAVIEENTKDALSSGIFDQLMNDDKKRLVHLCVDGVACEERIGLDVSRLPHQFVGLCLHNRESQFITMEDAECVLRDLDREGTDMSKTHFFQRGRGVLFCREW